MCWGEVGVQRPGQYVSRFFAAADCLFPPHPLPLCRAVDMAGLHHRGRDRRPGVVCEHGRAGRHGRRVGLSVRNHHRDRRSSGVFFLLIDWQLIMNAHLSVKQGSTPLLTTSSSSVFPFLFLCFHVLIEFYQI